MVNGMGENYLYFPCQGVELYVEFDDDGFESVGATSDRFERSCKNRNGDKECVQSFEAVEL
jgi:hypothetical protein